MFITEIFIVNFLSLKPLSQRIPPHFPLLSPAMHSPASVPRDSSPHVMHYLRLMQCLTPYVIFETQAFKIVIKSLLSLSSLALFFFHCLLVFFFFIFFVDHFIVLLFPASLSFFYILFFWSLFVFFFEIIVIYENLSVSSFLVHSAFQIFVIFPSLLSSPFLSYPLCFLSKLS